MALCLPAMSLMPPDRLWAAIVPCGARMTCLGRRASPSSAFRSQGLFRTADVKRYTRRLLLVACISETPLSGLFAERENRTTEMLRGPARLSINPKIQRNGKEDSYERLRPQARFGAQPPRSGGAWRGDNPGRVSQGELPRSGKRKRSGPFVFNHRTSVR